MDVGIFEGVVGFGPGGHAANFSCGREGVVLIIRTRLGGGVGRATVVVAHGAPDRRLPEHGRIHVEEGQLVLGVGPVIIGVVSEHDEQVGEYSVVQTEIGVAHRAGAAVACARVTQQPDAGRGGRAHAGGGLKKVIGIISGQDLGARSDTVEIGGGGG